MTVQQTPRILPFISNKLYNVSNYDIFTSFRLLEVERNSKENMLGINYESVKIAI